MEGKKYLILCIMSFIILVTSVFMSYRTGKTEYGWIIGSLLLGIGTGGQYYKIRKGK